MSIEKSLKLPDYNAFTEKLTPLNMPVSYSCLHGILCGYLCIGAVYQAEQYLQMASQKKDTASRTALSALFELFSVSQAQLADPEFGFQLFVPDDETPLEDRAKAFSEWCQGFTQSLEQSGLRAEYFDEEDSQEALKHLKEFSELNYEEITMDEHDEKAFMELYEYARIAVMRMHQDIQKNPKIVKKNKTTSH